MFVQSKNAQIKIEVNTVTRGHLFPSQMLQVHEVNSALSEKDRSFLLSFKQGTPDWDLFPMPRLKELPAVQWKLKNIRTLITSNPEKHHELTSKLKSHILKLK